MYNNLFNWVDFDVNKPRTGGDEVLAAYQNADGTFKYDCASFFGIDDECPWESYHSYEEPVLFWCDIISPSSNPELWTDSKLRLPVNPNKPILAASRNKNMYECGIWLYDCCYFDNNWIDRVNYEDVLYWSYIDAPVVK